MKILRQQINWNRDSAYHLVLFLLMASIPLSKYMTSVFQFALTVLWLWHGVNTSYLLNFSNANRLSPVIWGRFIGQSLKEIAASFVNKWKDFFRNKPAVLLSSLYVLLLIGILWTTDLHYALKDLRTKVPLFILPLFLATGPKVNTRTLNLMLAGYCLALFGGTIYQLMLLSNLPVADTRGISAHVSHIRFSLNLVLGIYSLLYLAWKKFFRQTAVNIGLVTLALWFLAFMIYMQYDTGVVLTAIVAIILLFLLAFRQSGIKSRIALLLASFLILAVPLIYISTVIHEFRSVKPVYFLKLDQCTRNGNLYTHDTTNFVVENGVYPGLYICDKELSEAWEKRSSIPYDGYDHKKQLIRSTIIRYMASKNLRKDAEGVTSLTNQDVRAIESGIANVRSINGFNIKTQIYNYIIAYRNYRYRGDPNSGSLVQRLEYWRTSWLIFRDHPVAGVGTGDLPAAFEKQYEAMHSPLKPEFRRRSHNQYLSTLVAFGVLGFAWYMLVLIYAPVRLKGFRRYYFLVYYIIIMISMITEDTLESQEGATFFAFFISLFLLAWNTEGLQDFSPVRRKK